MSPQPTHPPPPPVVQRLRIRYAKRGRLRFTSHRDFARAFERALRRAAVPMGYRAGFSPHPKISYVGAAPTGVASEAEYLEIGLAEERDPDDVRRELDAALPPGLDIMAAVPASGSSLADRIDASWWRVELPCAPGGEGADPAATAAALDRFLALEAAPVERMMKDGKRTIDARAAVVTLALADSAPAPPSPAPAPGGAPVADAPDRSEPCAILDLVVRHTTPAVRPDDVLTALRQAAALSTPVTPMVTRLAQGRLDETPPAADEPTAHLRLRLVDPLEPEVVAATPQ